MELPQVGEHCSQPDCNKLDFLPVPCALCNLLYCKDHASPFVHSCSKQISNMVASKTKSESFKCTYQDCSASSAVKMLCSKCEQHFCLSHRHHDCQELPKKDIDSWRAPKEQFKKVKAETDKQVEEKLRLAHQASPAKRALANKIRLMKIKGKAFGDNKVPVVDRLFFNVHYPLVNDVSKEARALFISKTWTVGRAIDFFAKRMKVENNNNVQDAPKLRLFIKENGLLVTNEMDTVFEALVKDQIIIDGDSLVLEYVKPNIAESNDFESVTISSEKYTG